MRRLLVAFAAAALVSPPLGLLSVAAGATKFPVFAHGVVLSIFPPNGARLLVALTIWSGAAATALGLVVYEGVLERRQEPADLF